MTPARATDVSTPTGSTPARARGCPTPNAETPARAMQASTPRSATPARASPVSTPMPATPARATPPSMPIRGTPARATIRTLGRLLDDLEHVRVQNGNRIEALERAGYERLPHLQAIQELLRAVEHAAELELVRAWRHHPLADWAKTYHGLGEKSAARLLAEIGDPSERSNPAKLLAYCGHGDPHHAGQIPKNATQEELFRRGNPRAKKQVWLIATSLLRAGNRDAYDQARMRYAEACHEKPCVRCGPPGHPAPPGSPLSDGHKHARALRALGKRFLLDLWLAATKCEFTEAETR